MNLDINFYLELLLWVAKGLFFIALIPQIFLNYQKKVGTGLSDLYLIGYLNGDLTYLFFTYCLDLPLSYKIIVPLCLMALLTIIFQRFYYTSFATSKGMFFVYFFNLVIAIACIPIAVKFPQEFGVNAGWLATGIWYVYQLPQIVKVIIQKTVVGFSFLLPTMIGLGNFVEFVSAYIIGLPVQTLFITVRGILISVFFCFLFKIYDNKNNLDESEVKKVKISTKKM